MADIGTSRDWNITLQNLVKIERWNCLFTIPRDDLDYLLENYINRETAQKLSPYTRTLANHSALKMEKIVQ